MYASRKKSMSFDSANCMASEDLSDAKGAPADPIAGEAPADPIAEEAPAEPGEAKAPPLQATET